MLTYAADAHSSMRIYTPCLGHLFTESFTLANTLRRLRTRIKVYLFVLRFYGPLNPMGSCRARSVYLTTRLLGRLSPLSG